MSPGASPPLPPVPPPSSTFIIQSLIHRSPSTSCSFEECSSKSCSHPLPFTILVGSLSFCSLHRHKCALMFGSASTTKAKIDFFFPYSLTVCSWSTHLLPRPLPSFHPYDCAYPRSSLLRHPRRRSCPIPRLQIRLSWFPTTASNISLESERSGSCPAVPRGYCEAVNTSG